MHTFPRQSTDYGFQKGYLPCVGLRHYGTSMMLATNKEIRCKEDVIRWQGYTYPGGVLRNISAVKADVPV